MQCHLKHSKIENQKSKYIRLAEIFSNTKISFKPFFLIKSIDNKLFLVVILIDSSSISGIHY